MAGMAAAMVLHQAGWPVTVFEAHPQGGDDAGAFLALVGHGMLALDAFGAADAVAQVGFPLHTLELTDGQGNSRGTRELNPARPDLPGYRCLHRSELYRALQTEAIRRGVQVRRGKRLVDAQQHVGGVQAIFADGTVAHGQLLVGADGVHSVVRTRIDPAAPEPRYVGMRIFYGYSPYPAPGARMGVLHIAQASAGAFGYTVSPRGETWWFARLPGPQLEPAAAGPTAPMQWREHLEAAFGQDQIPAAGIVAATERRLFSTNGCDIPTLPHWRSDHMVVLGDAAHAASPASGQGASMALEDAVVLGKTLRDSPTTTRALEAFERLRRPRVEVQVAASAALDTGHPPPASATDRAAESEDMTTLLDWNTPVDVPITGHR